MSGKAAGPSLRSLLVLLVLLAPPATALIIRAATSEDVGPAARNAVAALADDDMDAFLYPHRHRQAAAYLATYEARLDSFARLPDRHLIVAEKEAGAPGAPGHAEVVGHVEWYKDHGPPQMHPFRRKWEELKNSFRGHLDALRNPAASVGNHVRFDASPSAFRYFARDYAEPAVKWGVTDLIVAPAHQRQGVARQLLRWGMERAERDGVPIVLMATPAGRPLYDRAGFTHVGVWRWGKEPQMASMIMRWDPPPRSPGRPALPRRVAG